MDALALYSKLFGIVHTIRTIGEINVSDSFYIAGRNVNFTLSAETSNSPVDSDGIADDFQPFHLLQAVTNAVIRTGNQDVVDFYQAYKIGEGEEGSTYINVAFTVGL